MRTKRPWTRARSAPGFDESKHPRDERGRLPIVATRDRSQNWKQRSGLEKCHEQSHGLIRRGSNQAAHQGRNPFDFQFVAFRQAARNGSTKQPRMRRRTARCKII